MSYFEAINGRWRFVGSPNDLPMSRAAANCCDHFVSDDEDERTDDVERSCVNCAYRRWSITSFHCVKPAKDDFG